VDTPSAADREAADRRERRKHVEAADVAVRKSAERASEAAGAAREAALRQLEALAEVEALQQRHWIGCTRQSEPH